MRKFHFLSFAIAVVFAGGQVVSQRKSQSNLDDSVRTQLLKTIWIAYAPTHYNPNVAPPILPSEKSIRLDLGTLRGAGFDGLVTYGSDIPVIPRIAAEVGFRSMLLGVWSPGDPVETRSAKQAAHSRLVVGLIVGNEGLTFKRYDLPKLRLAMEEMRRDTGKLVSTTEIIEAYFTKPELAEWSDFLAVNAHPYFHNVREPIAAAEWTAKAYHNLAERYPDKVLLLKEVGLPTAAEGLNEQAQLDYYDALAKTGVKFVFFEAFDAMFKQGAAEQSWGLFRANREPKPAAAVARRH